LEHRRCSVYCRNNKFKNGLDDNFTYVGLFTKIISRWKERDKYKGKLYPECLSVIKVEDSCVKITHPKAKKITLAWQDLQCVKIVTTDQGPFLADVFWILCESEKQYSIPQGATGEQTFIDTLQKMDGFDNEQMIEAMRCTDNHDFIVWKRKGVE
jgi:hypothetical protein